MDPLVITIASTNVSWTKKDSPYMPETPDEIAADIIKAFEEGAAVAHIHARDDKGKVTFDPQYYRRIIEQVRKQCDIIIQISTGGPPAPIEEKLAPIRELRPEMASLNIRSSSEEIEYTAKAMKDLGVVPVIEAFHISGSQGLFLCGFGRDLRCRLGGNQLFQHLRDSTGSGTSGPNPRHENR